MTFQFAMKIGKLGVKLSWYDKAIILVPYTTFVFASVWATTLQ